MVGEDARRPSVVKGIELKLGILVGGAHSRVPDNRHDAPLSHNPVELSVSILPGYETVFKTAIKWSSLETDRPTAEVSQSHQPIVFETGGEKDTLLQLVA